MCKLDVCGMPNIVNYIIMCRSIRVSMIVVRLYR